MWRPVLETRCGIYVGQRTVETRAEARMTMSAAGRCCGICKKEVWKSDYDRDDVWEWEQRQTGGKLLPQALLQSGTKMCVSVFAAVGGGLVQTKAQCERCYSRAGEGERERDGLEGWRWGRIRVNAPHKPRASHCSHTRAARDSAAQAKDKEGKGQHNPKKSWVLSQIWSEPFRFGPTDWSRYSLLIIRWRLLWLPLRM